jgi:hypothetical protein
MVTAVAPSYAYQVVRQWSRKLEMGRAGAVTNFGAGYREIL